MEIFLFEKRFIFTSRLWCCNFRRDRFCGGMSLRLRGSTGSRLWRPTSASFKAFVPRVLDAIGPRVSAVAVPGPALPTTRETVFA